LCSFLGLNWHAIDGKIVSLPPMGADEVMFLDVCRQADRFEDRWAVST
jgi:hypothetical protein